MQKKLMKLREERRKARRPSKKIKIEDRLGAADWASESGKEKERTGKNQKTRGGFFGRVKKESG
mgnify:CR=1 FL=1